MKTEQRAPAAGFLQEIRTASLRAKDVVHGILSFARIAPAERAPVQVGPAVTESLKLRDRIFDPYFTTKEIGQGLGMGLAIVHGIVKKNEGAIRIASKPGRGTTVEVLFPLIDAPIAAEPQDPGDLPMGTERILVVDDEPSLVAMTTRMLERLGYTVMSTTSSAEALNLFRTQPDRFDLILTDMAMPEMAGDRLARELLSIRPDMSIILCTGHSDRIDRERAAELGILDYCLKPMTVKTLATEVRHVLDEARPKR